MTLQIPQKNQHHSSRRRAPLHIFAFHFLQERIRPYRWRNIFARAIALTRPKSEYQAMYNDLECLERDGYVMLNGLVNDEWVNHVRCELEQRLCRDRWRPELGQFSRNKIPLVTHVADIDDVIDIPEITEIANDPRILGVISDYFGCLPTIDSIKAWWSLPGHDNAENEQYFHRDNDSIRFIKLFVYLSDVDEDSGPHVFVTGSHVKNGCYERRRFQDNEVRDAFGQERIKQITGCAGTAFLEDTFGLHKGKLPNDNVRLLLQIRYSIIPTIFMSKTKVSPLTNIKSSIKKNAYVNRIILK